MSRLRFALLLASEELRQRRLHIFRSRRSKSNVEDGRPWSNAFSWQLGYYRTHHLHLIHPRHPNRHRSHCHHQSQCWDRGRRFLGLEWQWGMMYWPR